MDRQANKQAAASAWGDKRGKERKRKEKEERGKERERAGKRERERRHDSVLFTEYSNI